MAKDIKDTIAKLLRLSKSPNENEAMAALLKAQELMAKYKVEKYECEDFDQPKKRNLKKIVTDFSFSKITNPYTIDLGNVIADNFMCECIMNHKYAARNRTICFVGLEEDVELCALTMEFAYKAIMETINIMRKISKNKGNNAYTTNCICNSYMKGWVKGLEEKLREQREKEIKENPSYALVLVKPPELSEYMKNINVIDFNPNTIQYDKALKEGFKDGYNFDLSKELDTDKNKLEVKD